MFVKEDQYNLESVPEGKDESLTFYTKMSEWNGEICLHIEDMLASLLLDEICFVGPNPVVDEEGDKTLTIYVNSNDTFYYASADADAITYHEIPDLFIMKHTYKYGVDRWLSIKRNMRPLPEIQQWIKAAGEWDEIMENLQRNPYEK